MPDFTNYLNDLSRGEKVNNPFLEFMGMQLEELKEGYARFTLRIRPEFLQGAGVLQGGLSVAFADEAAAHAAMTVLNPGEGITTIELNNSFLSMVSGGTITAEATVFKRGKSLIIADAIVRDEKGKDISRSTITLMVLTEK